MELSDGGEEERPNNSKITFDPDTGMADITDLLSSSMDTLSAPVEERLSSLAS